jgi:hypothetical protein
MASRILPVFLCVLGCGKNNDDDGDVTDHNTNDGDADTDADTDSDTDTDADCDGVEIASFDPEDGADLVKLDAEVVVTFTGPVPEFGVPWNVDIPGATGTPTLAADRLSATWTPTGTLPPETTLTVNASVCNDAQSSTFTTLPPPIDPAVVPPHTYVIEWADLTITEPPLAALFEDQIPLEFVLIELAAIDPVSLVVDTAAAVGDDTDGSLGPLCLSSVENEASFELNPYVKFGPETLTFVVDAEAGTTSDAEDLTIYARVHEDGSALTDVRLSALLATEDLIDIGNCQTLQPLVQGTCKPCAISASGTCLYVEGAVPSADYAPGVDIFATCAL